jgi:hypothetical protein
MPAVQYRDGGEIFGNLLIHGTLSASDLCGGGGGGSGPYVAGSGTCSIQAFSDQSNDASGVCSTVLGGSCNVASGVCGRNVVVNGFCNTASGYYYSTVSNGYRNYVDGQYSTVSNGYNNRTFERLGTIVNGWCNRTHYIYGTVVNGENNISKRYSSTVLNGRDNTAGGCYSTILNGNSLSATGHYSLTLNGVNSIASHDLSIVTGTNQVSVSACMLHINRLRVTDLPTSDPHVVGVIWSNAGVLTVSSG